MINPRKNNVNNSNDKYIFTLYPRKLKENSCSRKSDSINSRETITILIMKFHIQIATTNSLWCPKTMPDGTEQRDSGPVVPRRLVIPGITVLVEPVQYSTVPLVDLTATEER